MPGSIEVAFIELFTLMGILMRGEGVPEVLVINKQVDDRVETRIMLNKI